MTNDVLGALKVILGAETDQLDAGLAAAVAKLSKFGTKLLAVAGFASLGAAAYEAGEAIKKAVDQADEMGKAAQKFGVPIEDLSKLKFAADLSGVSFEELGKGVGKLSKLMSESAGGSDEAGKGFRALGISVTDSSGRLRSSSDVMADIAGKFEGMKDGAGKTALAMSLFGKSGAELIPLLNSGKAGLKEMTDEAEKLGLVITDKTYKAAEAFNDNLTRLNRIGQGMVLTVTAQMLPALQTLSGMLVDAAKSGNRLSDAAKIIDDVIFKVTFDVVAAITTFERFNLLLTAMHNFLKTDITDWPKFSEAFSAVIAVMEGNKEVFAALPEKVRQMIESWKAGGTAALDFAGKTDAPVVAAHNFQKALDDLTIKGMELSGQFSNLAPGFVQQAVSLGILDAAHVKLGQTLMLTTAQQIALNDKMAWFKGIQITDENLLPWDRLNLQMTQLNLLLASGNISFDTYTRAAQKAADAAGMSFKAASESISQSFVDVANSIGGPTSRIVKIAQIAASGTALINTLSAQTYALAGPFPANLVAVGLIAAKGAALLAAIRSVNVPAMAAGGSFTMPGGISGVDNHMVTMALAAGERVDVTPARDSQSSGPVEVHLKGMSFRDMVSGDNLRDLVDMLNSAFRDGYRLKIV